ncbi:unnamed protein product [Schistosoma mattheei]|uniref:Uncharacterized protein n=1 Tax=Schistosoma mattheei TaxID=31246 RepID=A0A3P8J1D9_9TREM|nr:unnamed protein product [Schistosoma mattheei]
MFSSWSKSTIKSSQFRLRRDFLLNFVLDEIGGTESQVSHKEDEREPEQGWREYDF